MPYNYQIALPKEYADALRESMMEAASDSDSIDEVAVVDGDQDAATSELQFDPFTVAAAFMLVI